MQEKTTDSFKYLIDQFADIRVMRFRIPGWEDLSLSQKSYAYYLSEAAKWGRDIYWDQNFKYNLVLRQVLEDILNCEQIDKSDDQYPLFLEYAKRVFFSSGIHHHYAEDKFFPSCDKDYFSSLMGIACKAMPSEQKDFILDVVYSKEKYLQRRCTREDIDAVTGSSVNFYEGVNREEVDEYYRSLADENDTHPVSYGLNSKVVKDTDGKVTEEIWNISGKYGPAIRHICENLQKASEFCENETQKKAISLLIEYYRTGDLELWDEYNITWLKDTACTVDFINGFIEDYNDPLARKGAWEGYVNIKNIEASKRTNSLSENAQWFEDNSPVDPRFKKDKVRGVSAKVVTAVCIAGDSYPTTPIGINLPNADWIRKEHGSKSVTIANITDAHSKASLEYPKSALDEFAFDEEEKALYRKYGSLTDEIHTDLHECLGHGSGQILEGVSPNALGEYSSALEEARADLFGLYYIADKKMVELGILPDMEAYKAQYSSYIRNGLLVQLARIEKGRDVTEAHMQNRLLISKWCYEMGQKNNVIERIDKEGRTFFVVRDFEGLRTLFAKLLAEVQRIKSEGDYAAAKELLGRYAVKIDPAIHEQVIGRYRSLGIKPYGGFVNPEIVPVYEGDAIVDYRVDFSEGFIEQQIRYAKDYRAL